MRKKSCKYEEPCDCGLSMLCNHPENDDCVCEKEYCPLKNKKERKNEIKKLFSMVR